MLGGCQEEALTGARDLAALARRHPLVEAEMVNDLETFIPQELHVMIRLGMTEEIFA